MTIFVYLISHLMTTSESHVNPACAVVTVVIDAVASAKSAKIEAIAFLFDMKIVLSV